MSFTHALKRAGLSRAELARRFEMSRQTVSAWGEHPPAYAWRYVELVADVRALAASVSISTKDVQVI